MFATEDDDAHSATITVEDRLRDIFEARTIDDLSTAAFNHDNRQGLGKIEKMVIRAAIKAMNEHLSKDAA
jgi:hypothetical protein